MKTVREVIVVEGRYDKNAVAQAVSATIIETGGFRVFSDDEKISLLRKLARKRGLIILADSDKAGFFIRGRLRGMLEEANVKHAYIPDIKGREKRKSMPSREGKLGVEGMAPEIIINALHLAGATFEDEQAQHKDSGKLTKADMYGAGLSGTAGSAQKRLELLKQLGLPERLSAGGLLDVLNALFSRDEFFTLFDNGHSM